MSTVHSLLLNKGNQNPFAESTPDFVVEQPGIAARFVESQSASTSVASNSLSHETNRFLGEAPLLPSLFQHQLLTFFPGITTGIVPEQPGSTTTLGENKSAFTSKASSPLSQQTGREPNYVSELQNWFQCELQTSFLGNTPASVPERLGGVTGLGESQSASTSEASSSLFLQKSRCSPDIFQLADQFSNHIQTSPSRKIPALVRTCSGTTARFGRNQTASTSKVSNSLFQQRKRPPKNVYILKPPPKPSQQILFDGNVQASFPECQGLFSSFGKNPPASKSEASSSLFQQKRRCTPDIFQLANQFPNHIQTSPSRKTPAFVQNFSETTARFGGNQTASTSRAPNSIFQQRTRPKKIVYVLKPSPKTFQQPFYDGNAPASFQKRPGPSSRFGKNQSASTSDTSSFHSQQTDTPLLKTPFHHNSIITHRHNLHHHELDHKNISLTRSSLSFIPKQPRTTTSLIKNRPITKSRESQETLRRNYPNIVFLMQSPLKRNYPEFVDLTSPTKAVSASKEQITAECPKQKKGTIFSPIETSASRQQGTDKCPKKQSELHPIPREQEREVINTTMNIEKKYPEFVDLTSSTEVTTDSCHAQNEFSETSRTSSLISLQQSSTWILEFPLKNPSQHSKAFKDTKIEKDERLEKRPGFFGQFICVKCLVEFTTQDELLRHELIHFND